jgi:hypothetical protein
MTQTTDLEQRLRALAQRQRNQRGDMMYHGEADAEIIEAADELARLRAALSVIESRVRAEERERAARIADPPLMHRKGKVGLWRQRRAAIAAAIRSGSEG